MKKREIIEGVIKDYDFPNKGSFELDGKKVIVKGALPGQKVSCMVSKVRKDKAEARLLDVLERSEIEDAVPPCPGSAPFTITFLPSSSKLPLFGKS